MTMTYDPLEPRTNKSVYAFAAAIRDQFSAVLRSDFVAGQGFSRFQLWQTPSASAGASGLFLGDTTAARWNFRIDTSSNLALDRFTSGTGWKSALTFSNGNGSVGIGGTWPSGGKLSISDSSPWAAGGSMRAAQVILDTSPQAANIGAGIAFGFTYDDGGAIQCTTGITPYKYNSVSGDASGGLRFTVASIARGVVDALTLDPFGSAGFGGPISTGGGQGVVFIANAAIVPAANPTGGAIVYAQGGATKIRGSSGTTTTIAPADPHCPACGADFTNEHYNARYGYVSICWFCLAADLGDKPYVVRHQTDEHAAEVALRDPELIADAKAERLAEAEELVEAA